MKKLVFKNIQIIKYIFSGGLVTASNLLILFISVHYLKLWYLISSVIAFCFGVSISYILQKFFTFKNYELENIHKQFLNFFIFALIMLVFNTLLMYVFVDIIKIWYLLAQAVSSILIAFINYTYFNKVIFKKIKHSD
ncbi:MAG: GtrA family protein [Patescibacteria group bacterium]